MATENELKVTILYSGILDKLSKNMRDEYLQEAVKTVKYVPFYGKHLFSRKPYVKKIVPIEKVTKDELLNSIRSFIDISHRLTRDAASELNKSLIEEYLKTHSLEETK